MDSKEATTSTAPQSTDSTPPPPQPPPPPSPPTVPQSSSTPAPEIPPSSSANPNPNNTNTNPNPNQNTQSSTPLPPPQQQHQQQSTLQQSQIRDPLNRIRAQQSFSQFPSSSSSSTNTTTTTTTSTTTTSSSSLSLLSSPSITASQMQRGGLAIGVPAHHARAPPPQSSHFSSFTSSSINQPFGGMSRNSVNFPEQISSSNPNQVKSSIQGIQNMGMVGSLNSGSQMRPGGVPSHIQQRTVQPPMRPQAPSSSQSLATQKFQGHAVLRVPSMGSPSPSSPAGMPPQTQQWISATTPGKQMPPSSLSSPSFRQQMKPPPMQQRSHLPQQHYHPSPTVSHQPMPPAPQQQQPSQSNQLQEHNGQQYPPPRVHQPSPHQPLAMRNTGSGNQKSPIMVHSGPHNSTCGTDMGESTNQILSKRSIHELITQIDPSEKFDPEVEDILVEIADDFVESITTFACSLAKHRKSTVLEAKDILLHLERNWNMSLPGFGGDEIKNYKKPFTNDIHRERLAAIKKSMVGSDAAAYTKSSVGVATGNAKGHTAKAAAPTSSPKAREVP